MLCYTSTHNYEKGNESKIAHCLKFQRSMIYIYMAALSLLHIFPRLVLLIFSASFHRTFSHPLASRMAKSASIKFVFQIAYVNFSKHT